MRTRRPRHSRGGFASEAARRASSPFLLRADGRKALKVRSGPPTSVPASEEDTTDDEVERSEEGAAVCGVATPLACSRSPPESAPSRWPFTPACAAPRGVPPASCSACPPSSTTGAIGTLGCRALAPLARSLLPDPPPSPWRW